MDVLLYGVSQRGLGYVNSEIQARQSNIEAMQVQISVNKNVLDSYYRSYQANLKNSEDYAIEIESKEAQLQLVSNLLSANPNDSLISQYNALTKEITTLKKKKSASDKATAQSLSDYNDLQAKINSWQAEIDQNKKEIEDLKSVQDVVPTPVTTTPVTTTPVTDNTNEPGTMSITDYLSYGDASTNDEPTPGDSDNIVDIADSDSPEFVTELKTIPWYIYALGAGALIGAGILIFGGKKNK